MALNDWSVADSEDEDGGQLHLEGPSLDVIQTAPRTPPRDCPLPSTVDESLFTPPPAGIDSTIGNFTSVPSTSAAVVPKPRPRPRVVMKKAVTSNPGADIASTSFSSISDPFISVTTRTDDSIHPATSASFGFSDAVEDPYSSFGIAERAKMRSRKSQKPPQPPPQMNEVIELTSDEDELALKPTKRQRKRADPAPKSQAQTRPRPKPRLKVKPPAALPSGSSPSPPAIPDSPAPAPAPPYGSLSQPPASTLPTIPPSTPPQAREPTPLSSPVVTIRKRKRIRPLIAEDEDEMNIGDNPPGFSPSSRMPPPFFAPPSSSVPTDSGIEIPPADSLSGRGRKKQGSSSKKGTQKKAQRGGKNGKKGETPIDPEETVEDSAGVAHEPSTHQNLGFSGEYHTPMDKDPTATEKVSRRQTATRKGKARAIYSEEDELVLPPKSGAGHMLLEDEGEGGRSKENLRPEDLSLPKRDQLPKHTLTPSLQVRGSTVKPNLTPMSELIRRVNSHPSSPFSNTSRTYSPFLKSSRTMLSRIAPLHPNRRTPPPPLPRPPPPKKSKKQLEMEEKIEEELAETIEGWSCLADDERKALRKARIDAELGYED